MADNWWEADPIATEGARASGQAVAGTKPRPDYGQGAYETQDGTILGPMAKGGVKVLRAPQTAGAEARTRLQLGLGPSVEAEKNILAFGDKNPLNTPLGGAANILMGKGDNNSVFDAAAKVVGGQDFQNYQQAAKSFESAFMPILSGAAVSPSEAQRMVRAAIPQMGDSAETLRRKAKNRQMMINGAAKLSGQPEPFPDVGSTDLAGGAKSPPVAQPPIEGAKRGKDGAWYVEDPHRKGSFPRVDKGPNGKWIIQTAKGPMEWVP